MSTKNYTLDEFLDALGDLSDTRKYLARSWLGFGGRRPFGHVELRSYFREDGKADALNKEDALRATPLDVVDNAYAPRGVMLNDRVQPYHETEAHLPDLYRIQLRPRDYSEMTPARQLRIWHPHHNLTDDALIVNILEEHNASDVLAVPARKNANPDKGAGNVAMPPLRLTDGTIDAKLDVKKKDAALFRMGMGLDVERETVFNQAGIYLRDDKTWPVTITPQGLEFDAALPDPTRGFGDVAPSAGQIYARVRLETVPPGSEYKNCPFILRLVGLTENLNKDKSEKSITDMVARLRLAAGELIENQSPASLRLDSRGAVPPVFWHMRYKRLAHSQLRFVHVPGNSGEPQMNILPDSTDLRLTTRSDHPAARTAQARVHSSHVTWLKTTTGFKMLFSAGGSQDQDAAYTLAYRRTENGWDQSLDGEVKGMPVELPHRIMQQALTPIYRAANAIGPSESAPYAFLAVRGGWFQYPLPEQRDSHYDANPAQSLKPMAETPSRSLAMSGQIVFAVSAEGMDVTRGMSIEDATHMQVAILWSNKTTPDKVDVSPVGVAGQFLGFLFMADTSPTAQDAVPVWTAGDAATREVPLWFGPDRTTSAAFTWSMEKNETWNLAFSDQADGKSDEAAAAPPLAWLTPGPFPFVTNYPLTRSLPSAPDPSATRGLVPYAIEGSPRLHYAAQQGEILAEDELPDLLPSVETQVFGKAAQPTGATPLVQSLLLSTLHGPEFTMPVMPVNGAPSFSARLRYDLPVLDELFAWSDPPPAEPIDDTGARPEEPDTSASSPVVTALMPDKLLEVWRGFERKMRLTWTQDAVVSETLLPATGGATTVNFDRIAAPYAFSTPVSLTLSTAQLFGDLQFPDIPDQPGGLGGALVGLGGRIVPEHTPLALKIDKENKLVLDDGTDPQIQVTGYAADLYANDDAKFLTDARGSAVCAVPDDPAVRSVTRRDDASDPATSFHLLTMTADAKIATDKIAFGFTARDLPVIEVGGKLVFQGVTVKDETYELPANPIEGRRSFVGQAFDSKVLLGSLFEWRCYPSDLAPMFADGTDHLGAYEIATQDGAFSFRPLRLVRAEFDGREKLDSIRILGGLTLRTGQSDPGDDFAFGPDRVYDRDDLFVLTASRSKDGKGWTTTLNGYGLVEPGADEITLKANDAPSLSLHRRLEPDGQTTFKSTGPVAAKILLQFDSSKDWPNIKTARLDAHLFGARHELTSTSVSITKGHLAMTFAGPHAADDPAPLQLLDPTVSVALGGLGHGDTLGVDGVLSASPDKEDALFTYDGQTLKWLDLTVTVKANEITNEINHETGALVLRIDDLALTNSVSPLFGLTFPRDAAPHLDGAIACVFAADTGTMATGAGHIEIHSEKHDNLLIYHDILFGGDNRAGPSTVDDITLHWATGYRPCPINWPVDEMGVSLDKGGTQTLEQIAKCPLDPDDRSEEQSRLLFIKAGGETLTHEVDLTLTEHSIPGHRLTRTPQGVQPLDPIRVMAMVKHRLTSSAHEARTAAWWSMDHVAFTTAALMQDEANKLAFAARDESWGGSRMQYRGQDVGMVKGPEGIAPLHDANAAGFHDAGMIKHLWSTEAPEGTLIIGNSALRLPHLGDAGDPCAQVALLPWVLGLPDTEAFQSAETDRTWRISIADAWAAHAIKLSSAGTPLGLNANANAATIQRLVTGRTPGDDGPDPSQLLPVESAFFEPWIKDAPARLEGADLHRDAPYFLRALLAMRARWRAYADDTNSAWTAETLVPRPWQIGVAKRLPRLDSTDVLATVRVGAKLASITDTDGRDAVPADLTVLSRDRVAQINGYRTIRADLLGGQEGDAQAELRDIAASVMQRPAAVLRLARHKNHRASVVVRSLGRGDDPLAGTGAAIIRAITDIGASPCLGWPVAAHGDTGDARPVLAAHIEPDVAVQVPDVGFSARGQRTAWPAFALPHDNSGDALFASFGQHVVFDRDPRPFGFDGPAARHLGAAPVRRRAPSQAQTANSLTNATSGDSAPLSPVVIDRMTLGRRAGAMEVSTIALTQARGRGDAQTELDKGWPGMGRPADSGPVLAHAVRTPRSTLLPPDPYPCHIGLRRRTILSMADLTESEEGKTQQKLKQFVRFGAHVDVIRRHHGGQFWRIRLGPLDDSQLQIGPNWQGSLSVVIDAFQTERDGLTAKPTDPTSLLGLDNAIIAKLDIGGRILSHTKVVAALQGTRVILTISFGSVADVQTQLETIAADTPMSLTIRFPNAQGQSPVDDRLLSAPDAEMVVPVRLNPGQRRVVRTRPATIAFGDPAYDRALASPTAAETARHQDAVPDAPLWLLAADRREYNRDSALYLAFGPLNQTSNLFHEFDTEKIAQVSFRRFPKAEPGTDQDLSVALHDGSVVELADLPLGVPVGLRLNDLRIRDQPVQSPILAGDLLEIKAVYNDGARIDVTLTTRVRVVADPIIAPPASVYSVVETLENVESDPRARLRLHAPASLPSRIEFPFLRDDLALGHVRRQALFVWHYSTPWGSAPDRTDLLKLDRSGGAQLPDDGES